jgi:hypothetical protein
MPGVVASERVSSTGTIFRKLYFLRELKHRKSTFLMDPVEVVKDFNFYWGTLIGNTRAAGVQES